MRRRWPSCSAIVRIEWSPAARASARRYMHDQDGMRAIGAAVAALAEDPYPAGAFHRGEYHRLRVADRLPGVGGRR